MRRLAIRTRLVLLFAATALAVLVLAIAATNVLLRRALDADATRLAQARAAAALSSVDVRGGRIAVGETPDDRALDVPVWVVDAHGRFLEHPPAVPEAVQGVVRALARAARPATRDVPGAGLRLAAAPVAQQGHVLGAVVAAVSLAPYHRTESLALRLSVGLSLVLLLLGVLASYQLLRRALRPVGEMTQLARDWSESDPERRFSPSGPDDELRELARTLDAMLDRMASSLRRERRFAAELAHELRTPLTRIVGRTELSLRRERSPEEYVRAVTTIRESALAMQRTIDALMAAAQHEAAATPGRADVREVLADAAQLVSAEAARRGVAIELPEPDGRVRAAVEPDLLLRMVSPLLDNACRYARSRVSVALEREARSVVIVVRDDGPGVREDEATSIFEPAVRGSAGGDAPGAGLGLALARRLARSAGGDVTLDEATADGGAFSVRLPSA